MHLSLFPVVMLQREEGSRMDIILKRRSIRRYTGDPVSEQTIREVLEAAMCAPSAGNEQPWHFIVIRDRKILGQIPAIHPHAYMVPEAPIAVLVCGDLRLDLHDGFWIQDCSAATENILIAVQAKGLGAVWLGVYPREDRVAGLRKLLEIPNHVIPFALVPIGHPAECRPSENRYNPSRVHFDKW